MAQTNTVGDITLPYSGKQLQVTPSGTGNDGVLSQPNMLVALYNTDNVTEPLGGSAAPLYVNQGYLQAPNSQQPQAGDTVGVQRNWATVFSGYNQTPLPTPTTSPAFASTAWITGLGAYAELAIFVQVYTLGSGNSNFLVYVDTQDAFGNAYHLFTATTALAAGTGLLIGLGAGVPAQAQTGITGLNPGLTNNSFTTYTAGVGLPFGDSIRVGFSYTQTSGNAPTLYLSIKGK